MVIGDNTPVWSDLGQTATARHKLPGHRQVACASIYEDCPPEELFGLGTVRIPDQDSMGQVMFPGVKRADYAVNPLSGFGVPGHDAMHRFTDDNSSELFGLGQEVFGQVMFPGIKRADYASNPLSGFGTVRIPDTESMGTVRIPDADGFGTVRVPDDSNAFAGYFGQEAAAPAGDLKAKFTAWNGAGILATALLYGASIFAKGNLKEGLRTASYVAGGMTAVGLVKKIVG